MMMYYTDGCDLHSSAAAQLKSEKRNTRSTEILSKFPATPTSGDNKSNNNVVESRIVFLTTSNRILAKIRDSA